MRIRPSHNYDKAPLAKFCRTEQMWSIIFLKEKNIDSMALSPIIKTFAISMPKPNTRVTKVQFTKLVI